MNQRDAPAMHLLENTSVKQDISNKYKFLLFSLLIIDWTINIIRL